jgi:DNA-binding SARP family transcriptional activator/WD40 repeat protein
MAVLVLGAVVVEGDGGLSPRDRAVLGALAVERGRPLRPDQLADALWGERPPSTWPKQVQACVAHVRKVLGPEAIETTDGGYRLTLSGDDLDIDRFEQLVARGRDLAATGEPDRAASTFARALGLWRGPPFAEFDTWPPAVGETARLDELRSGIEEELLDARLASGEHRDAAAAAEALVADEPLRERRWALLALAQYRCGRQADALRTLQRARHTLVEQLGVDPGRELVDLESAILNQDEALDHHALPAPVSDDCPYKGLEAYDVDDRDSFFGRDAQVAACLDRLRTTPVLVVTGPSGCGKSSLVRAGLAPALARADRPVAVIVPGAEPLAALAEARARGDRVVVIVDQFEELFALGVDTETVREFCASIAERATTDAPAILAIRADHLTAVATDPNLGRIAERGLHFVAPLSGDELRQAIEQPARQAGLRVEHGLVDLLVRDAEGEPGALPLLSHALVETWRRRDGKVLTVEGYRASGGIRGAVARSADRLYDSLPAEQRPLLRSLMLRLVTPSLEGDPVRCRIPARALVGDAARERIVAALVQARLLTTEEDTVELAHEALARAWPRLRSWLDEDAAGQRILRHLAATADGWESLGRPETELYRGARLDTAAEYVEAAGPDLTTVEREFIDVSRAHARSEHEALVTRARLDARRNRRLRTSLLATGLLLVAALVAGSLALRSGREASDQRDEAELEALVNRSLALRSTDRDVAALLAVEAARRWPGDARGTSALMGSFTAAGGLLGHRYLPDASWLDGALVPGTSSAVVALDGDRLALLDVETGELDERFPVPDGDTGFGMAVKVSGDGRHVVHLRGVDDPSCFDLAIFEETNGRDCATFSVYDVASGSPVLGPITPPVGPGDVAISDDGSLVAVTGGYSGDVAVYRTDSGELVGTVSGLARPERARQVVDTGAVGFGPDDLVYAGSLAGPVRVIDSETMHVARTIDAPPISSNRHVTVGSDGDVVAVGDEAMLAADMTNGEARWTQDLRGRHSEPCPFFAVSEASGRLYCGDYFGIVEERDRATGQRTGSTLPIQLGAVGALSITPDGRELVAFRQDAPAVARWRLDGGGLVTRKVAEGHAVYDGYDFADGSTVVVAQRDPAATIDTDFSDFAVWDVIEDREVDPLDFNRAVEGVGWVGRDVITGFLPEEERIAWFDVTEGSMVDGFEIPAGPSVPVECGRIFPAADETLTHCLMTDGDVWRIDPATRQRTEPTIHVEGLPLWVSATRDGERVVVTTADGVTTVHDGDTGEQIGGPLEGPVATQVSLDGVLIGATTGITRYDLDTLQPTSVLPGSGGEVDTVQLSDDGATLLATSLEGTLSLYDVPSGTRLGDPIEHFAPDIYAGFLRHDGGELAVTDATGVAIWDLDPDHLRHAACTLAGRNLTSTEWETYLAGLGEYRPTCPEFA